ncbi:hypothetical protein CDL15_Pgr016048 [Punica granatum]|uniref:Uncharacterized protein n=1 Tax=Punica granatum TaxID=22663 RepID=A0A218XR58_PUNGR|nr:hypothetical protein CDL15_Pgr016048 [Punica granatum]
METIIGGGSSICKVNCPISIIVCTQLQGGAGGAMQLVEDGAFHILEYAKNCYVPWCCHKLADYMHRVSNVRSCQCKLGKTAHEMIKSRIR